MNKLLFAGNDNILIEILTEYSGGEYYKLHSIDEIITACKHDKTIKLLYILNDVSGAIEDLLEYLMANNLDSSMSCFYFVDSFSECSDKFDIPGFVFLLKNSIMDNKFSPLSNIFSKNKFNGEKRFMSVVSEFGGFFPEPFCLTDENFNILYGNLSFKATFRESQKKLIGEKIDSIFEKNITERFYENRNKIDPEGVRFEVKINENISIIDERKYSVYMKYVFYETIKNIVVFFQDVTEYLDAQEQINMFNRIIEQMPSSVVITDKAGTIEYVNEKFINITGYSFEEAVGNNLRILKSGEQDEKFYSQLWNKILGGDIWKGELSNRGKNGETFWESATIIPLKDRKGEVTHFVAIKENITEYKEIEQELEEFEIKFQTVFSSIKEGLAILSDSGEILQVNKAFVDLVGESSESDVAGKRLTDYVSEEDRSRVEKYCSSVFGTEENITFDYQSHLKGETQNDFEMSVASLIDQRGTAIGYTVLLKDISERKKNEQQLMISEKRHRALVEAVPDLMFRLNDEGMFIDEIFRKKISKVFPEKLNSEIVEALAKAFRTNEIQTYEYPVEINDSLRYYEARFIVSGISEVLVIVRNVTDRHRAEEELKKARDEAETANRAKSEFLANMSHEIRTPLNGIMGFIEVLKKSRLDKNQQEYMNIVSLSARSLLGIINDILDFSKIESRKLEIDMAPFDPLKEFESIIDLFYVRAVEKNIELLSFIDPNLPGEIIGDPLRIKQVLSNLLSNALKFTPEYGFVNVTIRKQEMKDGICKVLFSVADSGIGISEYKKDKIFEAFEQMDPSITRRFGGTGLGLTIALNLVKLMGGDLDVKSKKGEGSDFYFLLEFGVGSQDEKRRLSVPFETLPEVVLYRRNHGSELEDLLLKYLISFKFQVKEVNDLDEFNVEKKSDVVFFVYHDENWYDVVAFIKAYPQYPVIIVSGAEGLARLDELRSEKARIVMPPLNPSKIFNAIIETYNGAIVELDDSNVWRAPVKYILDAKVLVAEDNPVNQMLMRIMLQEYGIDVVIVSNGIEAFDCRKNEDFNLILMDINMPVADGIETTEMIRYYESTNNLKPVPIVALTARAMKGDREDLLSRGMDGYIPKPIEESSLREILLQFLSGIEVRSHERGEVVSGEAYNKKEVAAQLGIPLDALDKLINTFLENSEQVIESLEKAANEQNRENVEIYSHKLKGASYNFRFNELGRLSEAVEVKAASENFEIIMGIISEIKKEYNSIRYMLNAK